MHALTRETNFSECTFVFPPEQAGTDFRVRIFNRNGEAPFAGHPTIGSAFALAHAGRLKPGVIRTMFGLGVGPTTIDLDWKANRLAFAWMTQPNPTFGRAVTDQDAMAAAIGVEAAALKSRRAPAQEIGCGSTFLVPAEKAGAIVNVQGVLAKRPSRIHINIGLTGTDITSVKVGGASVVVGEGTMTV